MSVWSFRGHEEYEMVKFVGSKYKNGEWECVNTRIAAKWNKNTRMWFVHTPWGGRAFTSKEVQKAHATLLTAVLTCWRAKIATHMVDTTVDEVLYEPLVFQAKVEAVSKLKHEEWDRGDLVRDAIRAHLLDLKKFVCTRAGSYTTFYGQHKVTVHQYDDKGWLVLLNGVEQGKADPALISITCSLALAMSRIDEFVNDLPVTSPLAVRVTPYAVVYNGHYISYVNHGYMVDGTDVGDVTPAQVVRYCYEKTA